VPQRAEASDERHLLRRRLDAPVVERAGGEERGDEAELHRVAEVLLRLRLLGGGRPAARERRVLADEADRGDVVLLAVEALAIDDVLRRPQGEGLDPHHGERLLLRRPLRRGAVRRRGREDRPPPARAADDPRRRVCGCTPSHCVESSCAPLRMARMSARGLDARLSAAAAGAQSPAAITAAMAPPTRASASAASAVAHVA
jgi:hypothetical protein